MNHVGFIVALYPMRYRAPPQHELRSLALVLNPTGTAKNAVHKYCTVTDYGSPSTVTALVLNAQVLHRDGLWIAVYGDCKI